MQSSVASCCIVSILSLATAVITGAVGITQRQVSACMVTGVMYGVAGKYSPIMVLIFIFEVYLLIIIKFICSFCLIL